MNVTNSTRRCLIVECRSEEHNWLHSYTSRATFHRALNFRHCQEVYMAVIRYLVELEELLSNLIDFRVTDSTLTH